jgi:hypothetical protein
MILADMLKGLSDRGVRMSVLGDRLRWLAPSGVLTEVEKLTFVSRKKEILTALLCGSDGCDADLLSCWLCWIPWQPGWLICRNCAAIAPGLSEDEIDRIIYGPGVWL